MNNVLRCRLINCSACICEDCFHFLDGTMLYYKYRNKGRSYPWYNRVYRGSNKVWCCSNKCLVNIVQNGHHYKEYTIIGMPMEEQYIIHKTINKNKHINKVQTTYINVLYDYLPSVLINIVNEYVF